MQKSNPNRLRYIYFDIDDTLLDHKAAERQALQDSHEHFDWFKAVSIGQLWNVYHKNNSRLWIDYGAGTIDRPYLEEARFSRTLRDLGVGGGQEEAFRDYYMQAYEKHWQWIEGAKQALILVSGKFPVGFITNGFTELQRRKAERFGFYDISENYIISEEVGFMKPSPGIFEFATRKADVQPDEILYVGDSFSSDVLGAHGFGWKAAWYVRNAEETKAREASLIFSDFRMLTDWLEIE